MINVSINSTIDVAIADERAFMRQLPFAFSQAMNDATFEARHHIVEQTWPRAFEVRNRTLPGAMFKVLKRANKRDLRSVLGQRAMPRSGILDWVSDQAEGGIKTPNGHEHIAIPPAAIADSLRTSTGRIAKRNKPRKVTDRKDTHLVLKGGKKRAIVQRNRGSKNTQTLFIFTHQAKIPKRFMFYEDAERVFLAEITPAYYRRLGAIITSRDGKASRGKLSPIATATQGHMFP